MKYDYNYNVNPVNWDDHRVDEIQFVPASLGVNIDPSSNVCSVIAVALALNLSFDDAYELLMFEGYSQRKLFNTISVLSKVLEGLYEYHKIHYKKVINLLEFIKTGSPSKNITHSYLILIPGHIFYYNKNMIYDGQLRGKNMQYYVFQSRENRIRRLQQPVIGYYESIDESLNISQVQK